MLLPKSLIKDIEKDSRQFLWGDSEDLRKIHLVSWDQVSTQKTNGGLGIKNLRRQNEALILKLCWKLMNEPQALWVQVLRSFFINVIT